MRRHRGGWLGLACLLALSAVCSAAADAGLASIPDPVLEVLENTVRERLQAQRVRFEEQRSQLTGEALGGAYGELGRWYHAHQLHDSAEACYQNAALLQPKAFDWPYLLGHMYQELSRMQEAATAYERALSLRADYGPLRIRLAQTYLGLHRPEQAASLLEPISADPVLQGAAAFELGKAVLELGHPDQALTWFHKALHEQPQANRIRYPLAMAYRALGDTANARLQLQQRGETDPDFPDPIILGVGELLSGARTHQYRAMKAVWAKRFDVAAREFGKIVALEPNNAEARVSLARSLYMQGQAALAREQLEQALSREPGHAKAHYFLGRLLREQGSSEAALEHFRATLETDPNHAGALYVLGEVLTRAGQDAQAQAHLAKVVEQFPQETTPRLLLARALAKTGQADQARKQLENGVQMYPGEAGLRRMLARLLAASPQPEVRDGRRALALAVALFDQRNSIENAETVAMAYAEVGDFETAHAYQQAAIDAAMRFGGFADLPRLNANLALYRKTTPCRTPWPEGGEFSELEPFSDATSE